MTPEPRDLTEPPCSNGDEFAEFLRQAMLFRGIDRKTTDAVVAFIVPYLPKRDAALLKRTAEVLDQAHVALLGLCAGKPVLDADEVICAVIRSKAELRARAG